MSPKISQLLAYIMHEKYSALTQNEHFEKALESEPRSYLFYEQMYLLQEIGQSGFLSDEACSNFETYCLNYYTKWQRLGLD